ncbi:MAG: glycosyltransferase family 4 protein [Chloroflexota bacterium]
MKTFAGKRILMIVENNSYPGDGRVRKEAQALTSAGYQVSVISPKDPNQSWREEINGVSVFRYPAPLEADGMFGYFWEYSVSLASAFILSLVVLFGRGFDVLHAHNPPDIFVLLALVFKPFGKKFVFDHHDLSPEMYMARFDNQGNKFLFNILVQFEILTCRVANHIIATNESYKAMEIERSGVPEDKITVVRNGPDLNRLKIVEPDPKLRSMGKTIFGYVGVMGYQDGIDYFLRALHHLIHDIGRTDFYAVLIGDGDAWESLQAETAKLELEDYVWFTGPISDDNHLSYLLCSTDICVDPDPYNPYNDRSSMIKMTEYMALAKPIVAFDLREHRVTAQEAAIYADKNNELDFAKQLALLMDNPEKRDQMGKFGRRRIEAELSWHHQQQNLIRAYHKISESTPELVREQKMSS